MKISPEEFAEKAVNAIHSCLEGIPFVEIKAIIKEVRSSYRRPDLLITVGLPYGEQSLIAEMKSSGEPRYVREAASQLVKYRYSAPPGTYGLVIAPFISPKAAEICAEEKIGYVDFSGNCLLSFGYVYLERQGRPNLFAERRDLRSLYSPKAERILRVLLTSPHGRWKLQDLAKEAQVSLGQVSKVKALLGAREWSSPEHGQFQLTKPFELLSEWAANYDAKRNEGRNFYTFKKVWEFEADLAEACAESGTEYALTGFSGAARLAPAVRYQRAAAYVNVPQEELAFRLGLKEVSSGANVLLMRPYDAGVFYGIRSVGDIRIASPVQLYLDLMAIKGRGEEAAQAVLEQAIMPLW
ncbi:type IV toxin-antitoxin system AbiEi family antitoxin [Syntrophobacter fumaroxidans]|uniref:Transcriptional regulator, AbiEi antitoxin, Type IV TA system n=1 Tax=Syntrophobacter fumaroxidans (strain DSM 10017 / MPOB) TaxID=335543 RepID=A0LN51_SYNFM|nr:type IV toxin-antitoxin system AbiEi family antitoxin [Syntrophobacter fumaroxidans]ABK18853.1 conserved hypothetical protein [Syntrophobacter fumaroxidans MPOB]